MTSGVPAQAISTVEALSTLEPIVPSYKKLFTHIVKPGETFAGILGRFGVSQKHSFDYYQTLKSVGLPALFPGDSLVLIKDECDKVQGCSLLSKLQHWYHLQLCDTTVKAHKTSVPITKHLCVLKGHIERSLYEDMRRLGGGDGLVFKLMDIFAWDINFFMDPRKGDQFEVLFEKKYREGTVVGYGQIFAAKYMNAGREYYAIALQDSLGHTHYYNKEGKSLQKEFLKAPLKFRRISSKFSYRRKHPILGIYRPHLGIDYAAPRGTPVYSAADGYVTFAGYKSGYGYQVRVKHGASYQTWYGHLAKIGKGIKKGTALSQGQYLGTVGATGLATGPHLDYRMKIGSRFVNPLTISPPAKKGVSDKDLERFAIQKSIVLATMENRFTKEGCFLVEVIGSPLKEEAVVATGALPQEKDHGDTPSS